ncbi:MAG: hypothetical protein K9N51_11835, partial [Candidatus Pacebacteria bacterium]|nr:hypothetical protein [Candidatus Paceibacterota bacterium]
MRFEGTMKYFVLHLNAHQPRRFKKRSTLATPYDDVLNQEALAEDAATVYLPANDLLLRLLRSHDSLCISVSISGVLIELARRFQPEVLASFQELGRVASDTGRVEFVGTTYYHSLAGLFRDGNRDEMKAQADLHRELMNEELGVRPSAFCHAEWMYSNAIGAAAAAVGFQTVLCQGPSANFAHADITTAGFAQHPGKRVGLLLRHGPVSAALCTAGHGDVSAQAFLDDVRRQQERVVLAGIDYENWAGRHWDGTETAVFWEELATLLESADDIAAATPTSVTEKASDSPILTVDDHQPVSRTGGVTEWVGSPAQHELFFRYQDLENRLKTYGDANLLRIWRTLGAACHFYGMQGSEE